MLFFFYAFKIIPFIKVKILFKNERVRESHALACFVFFNTCVLGYCSLYMCIMNFVINILFIILFFRSLF